MEITQFFDKITQQIDDIKYKKQQETLCDKYEKKFMVKLIPRILTMLVDYSEFIQSKGIPVTLKSNKSSFEFTMHFSSGEQYGFGIGAGISGIELSSYLSGKSRHPRTILIKKKISGKYWSDDDFEIFIQECVSDFIIREMKHGMYI